jgi:asparagine synthase (glutamine-hydrolysing)
MKALLAHPKVKRDIDPISLNEYLSFEYVPSPRTIITNVFRLPAGHWLTYSNIGLKMESYYQLSLARSEMQPPVNWRDYTATLDDKLRESIKQELVSDVPVGVLLSGGVDSSTVAAYMAELYPGKVKSFSIGFEEKSFDESVYARMVAKRLDTEHHELILSGKKAGEMVSNIAEHLDEPFGDSSYIPTFLLSQFTRQQVKVALGGDGGDELFAGYPTLTAHKLINYYEQIVPWSMRAYVAPAILKILPVSFNNISFDFKVRRFLSGRGYPIEARHQRWLGSLYDEDKQQLLQDWIKPVLRDTYHMAYHYAHECDATQYLNRLLFNDINLYLEGDILFKVDRASMANSLEVRVPLLNRDLVDYITTLPIELKLHGFTGKYLLKKCVERRLPSEIIYRPKKGFNMPVARWMTQDLRELVEHNFSETTLKNQGLFKHQFIKKLFDDHLEHRRDNRKPLWTLLVFQLWYAKYMA